VSITKDTTLSMARPPRFSERTNASKMGGRVGVGVGVGVGNWARTAAGSTRHAMMNLMGSEINGIGDKWDRR
jgi:hypothetical protein